MSTNHKITEFEKHSQKTGTAIRLDNISVRFRINGENTASIKEFMIRRLQGKINYRDVWALRNFDLKIPKGAGVGIIGHNGAGKSTLLRVVARILKPTEGRVRVQGKVSPILGIGAGFHPELTGRENIFLSGAFLGFSRNEMKEKFNAIVNFAELWDFIDAPFRTYSSGMQARLGFAVATDVQPDILVIDEVLSAGDGTFRIKSAERLRSFQEQGVTLLLVSHNLEVIGNMCQYAALIDQGSLQEVGPVDEVINRYISSL